MSGLVAIRTDGCDAQDGWLRFHSTQPSPWRPSVARTRRIARWKWEMRPSRAPRVIPLAGAGELELLLA
jgi:hypothetical protein